MEREREETGLGIASFHTVLYCRKWAASVSFYRDVLGLTVSFENPLFVELRAASEARIGLLDASRTRYPDVEPKGVLLSFRVADVDKAHAWLRTKAVRLSDVKEHPWGARLFELEDPDGRRIELWAPAPPPSASDGTLGSTG
ncbi:MAG: VOC family protein [bacterium]